MKLEEAYARNVAIRESGSTFGELAPYDWMELPDHCPVKYMVYKAMLKEYSMELANSANQLRAFIGNLSAWGEVLADSKDDKFNRKLVLEFVDPLATVAINLPYVIRSRFIYSIAHLCHQANQVKVQNWKDDLPLDSEIYFKQADLYGKPWKRYRKLKLRLEEVSNQHYTTNMSDFRNKYNHRHSPKIEYGLTALVVRNVNKDGRIAYTFGQTEPLKVKHIVELLKKQHEASMASFIEYQKLVREQIAAIGST